MPRYSTATKLLPSAEEATDCHWRTLSRAVQVAPKSVEVYKLPTSTAATSLLPLADEATDCQLRALSRAVQVTPESVEVYS